MSPETVKAENDNREPEDPKLPLKVTDPICYAQFLIDNVELRKFYKSRKIMCFDCGASEVQSFEQGSQVHASGPYGGFDAQKLVDELNELGKKHPFKESTRIEMTLTRRIAEWLFPSTDD